MQSQPLHNTSNSNQEKTMSFDEIFSAREIPESAAYEAITKNSIPINKEPGTCVDVSNSESIPSTAEHCASPDAQSKFGRNNVEPNSSKKLVSSGFGTKDFSSHRTSNITRRGSEVETLRFHPAFDTATPIDDLKMSLKKLPKGTSLAEYHLFPKAQIHKPHSGSSTSTSPKRNLVKQSKTSEATKSRHLPCLNTTDELIFRPSRLSEIGELGVSTLPEFCLRNTSKINIEDHGLSSRWPCCKLAFSANRKNSIFGQEDENTEHIMSLNTIIKRPARERMFTGLGGKLLINNNLPNNQCYHMVNDEVQSSNTAANVSGPICCSASRANKLSSLRSLQEVSITSAFSRNNDYSDRPDGQELMDEAILRDAMSRIAELHFELDRVRQVYAYMVRNRQKRQRKSTSPKSFAELLELHRQGTLVIREDIHEIGY